MPKHVLHVMQGDTAKQLALTLLDAAGVCSGATSSVELTIASGGASEIVSASVRAIISTTHITPGNGKTLSVLSSRKSTTLSSPIASSPGTASTPQKSSMTVYDHPPAKATDFRRF